MFTGLVQHCGAVVDRRDASHGATLVIDATGWAHTPVHGQSIAVNGCCLTVRRPDDGAENKRLLHFDVIHETLRRTTLGRLNPGDRVNLEHAVTPATLLGGHIVQGHIDGVGTVTAIEKPGGGDAANSGGVGGEYRMRIAPPGDLLPYITSKGSIALEGVSLTIAAIVESAFEVALIPTTLQLTTLGALRTGNAVNLEADYIAKIVVQQFAWFSQPRV